MKKTLDTKLAILAENPSADCFILADAKDPDMARGVASAGKNPDGSLRSIADLRDLRWRQRQRSIAAIDHGEIVADAVHLGEAQLHCLPESCVEVAGVVAGCAGCVCGF